MIEDADLLWDRVLRPIEPGGVLYVVGGPPCQQLSPAGQGRGHLGLTGSESRLCYAFPLLVAVAIRRRPDVQVHFTIENAGAMQDVFAKAIEEAMGMKGRPRASTVIDAGPWAGFPRRRTFVTSLPAAEAVDRWRVPRRPAPWESGWAHPGGELPTLMRARSRREQPIQVSPYQYAPRFLVFTRELASKSAGARLAHLSRAVPERHQEAWKMLRAGRLPGPGGPAEGAADRLA